MQRETKKSLYISTYITVYKIGLAGTIWTDEGSEQWIELAAINAWDDRKKDVENKADAIMYGRIDAKTETERVKKVIKEIKENNKALN